MLLAGAEPVDAVRLQLIMLWVLLGGVALSALIATSLAYRNFFTAGAPAARAAGALAARGRARLVRPRIGDTLACIGCDPTTHAQRWSRLALLTIAAIATVLTLALIAVPSAQAGLYGGSDCLLMNTGGPLDDPSAAPRKPMR